MPQDPSTRSSRLSEASGTIPFRRATSLTRCELYWLPALQPAGEQQKKWTLRFLLELIKRLSPAGELKPELFIEAGVIYPDLQDKFIQSALDFNPIMGFSRKPGGTLPSIPDTKYAESIRRQETPFELKPFIAGICYWFLKKQLEKQLELFWGFGGMTLLLVKSDPATQAPQFRVPPGAMKHPLIQSAVKQSDIQGMLDMAFSTQSGFLKKSKEYFGTGWEDRIEYRALLYVLPRWSSEDFFNLPDKEIAHLFELCDLFVTESTADKGVILASSKPIEDSIQQVITKLREEGIEFPG